MHSIGGMGGEAPQADGRGGRGGRAHMDESLADLLGIKFRRKHMRWPYGEPVTEPGRGGDSADTPQYKARRVIVERLKAQYVAERGIVLDDDVWWDRDVVPLDWINSQIIAEGHRWQATLVDDEYDFSDLD